MNALAILRKLVEMAGGPAEEGYILALDGEGLEGMPEEFRTPRGDYSVHRPQTELGLRRLIWKAGGAPFVALLKRDLATRLPPDLIRRARGAKVLALALTLTEILGLALGVQVVRTDDPGLQSLALHYVDDLQRVMSRRTLPTVVDQKLLDELLLEAVVGQRIREATPAELLAAWVGHPPSWDEAVGALVRRNLPSLKGAEGRILAWALGDARRLRALVVRGALLAVESEEVPEGLWGSLWEAASDKDIGLPQSHLRARLVALASGALDALAGDAAPLLTEAESEARRLLPPSMLERNPLLPLGLESRCAAVAQAVADGEAVTDAQVGWLRDHRAAAGKRHEIAVLEELARLSRWLARPVKEAGSDLAVHIEAYRTEGAFADLAATRLQRGLAASAEFHGVAAGVLARYRAQRNVANRAFAELLAGDYAKALNNEAACPLHRVFNWFALPDAGADGRLYVVVLDGCSYPVFLELVYALAQDPTRPIGLSFDAQTQGRRRAGLALLPSVTSHSRGALFLGQIPSDPLVAETVWRDERERTTDPARFAQNAALGSRTRRLFLKGDLTDGGAALLATLADPAVSVVAAVFNAVDDQIGSKNTGVTVDIRPEMIKAFVPSLTAALKAGRRVLVTADHGHSPFVSTELKRGNKGPARFVELANGAEPPEGFIVVDAGSLGGVPGRKAFAWEMGAYVGTPHVAYHGGCGLEELVVPLVWLVDGGVMAEEPAWWYGRTVVHGAPAAPAEGARAEAKAAAREPAAAPRPQLDLFDGAGAVAARAAKIGVTRLPDAVVASLDDAERAALVVLAENGEARATDIGKAIGKPSFRVSGFMTRLGRRLHEVDGKRFRVERMPSGETRYVYIPPSDEGGEG